MNNKKPKQNKQTTTTTTTKMNQKEEKGLKMRRKPNRSMNSQNSDKWRREPNTQFINYIKSRS
jgi:hypothetical protein